MKMKKIIKSTLCATFIPYICSCSDCVEQKPNVMLNQKNIAEK